MHLYIIYMSIENNILKIKYQKKNKVVKEKVKHTVKPVEPVQVEPVQVEQVQVEQVQIEQEQEKEIIEGINNIQNKTI